MDKNRRKRVITVEDLRFLIKKAIEPIRDSTPEGANDLRAAWDSLIAQSEREDRLPVLFAMYQTIREEINKELPDELKQDISFPVEVEEGKVKKYNSYKEFLDDCQGNS